ncbi:MAG TPA: YHS domain-containing protein [Opitutus sp.]|nr:YHS domain-containing protein [Opitutus sp.]
MNTRNVFIVIGTFVLGALIALIARTAMYQPHAAGEAQTTGGGEYSAMVSNPLKPATSESATSPAKTQPARAKATAHDSHDHENATLATSSSTDATVNDVCAICGMKVNPDLETLEYQGKTIGFGCKLCAPKFKADPDRYGPAYLKNEVIKR